MIYPVISIRQPWAELIISHGKDIENRTWRIPRKYLNTPVLIHAGKAWEEVGDLHFIHELKACAQKALALGGIVGALVFEGMNNYRAAHSKWAEPGLEHWAIEHAWPVPFHPCRGQLGFFQVDYPHDINSAKVDG